MNKKYQKIMLTAALVCGLHGARADEPEDIVLPVPPPPFEPEFNLKIAPIRAIERLHQFHVHLHDRIHQVVTAPLKLLAQVAPPTGPVIAVEAAPPAVPA